MKVLNRKVKIQGKFTMAFFFVLFLHFYTSASAQTDCGKFNYDCQVSRASEALERNPKDVVALFNRAVIFYDLGKKEEAIADIEQVLEINPNVHFAYFFYGFIFYNDKDFERALEWFSKAIELKPDYKKAYLMRAKTFEKLGETNKARSDLEKLKELEINA
jgi:tetratricopeptide (TPR) repeat protein